MIELKNEIMKDYLKKGLQIVYSSKEKINEGTYRELFSEENGDYFYQVIWMNDSRINNGVEYVQVMRRDNSSYWSNWTHHLSKSLDFSIFEAL